MNNIADKTTLEMLESFAELEQMITKLSTHKLKYEIICNAKHYQNALVMLQAAIENADKLKKSLNGVFRDVEREEDMTKYK